MKKTVLFVLMILGTYGTACAQSDSSKEKRVAVEVELNPFSTDSKPETFSLGTNDDEICNGTESLPGTRIFPVFNEQYKLWLKYYTSDRNALRLGFGLGLTSNHKKLKEHGIDSHESSSKGIFSLTLGDEYQFFSQGRLDIYAGGDLGLFYAFVSEKSVVDYYRTGPVVKDKYFNRNTQGEISQFGIRLGAVMGMNFFVYKQLYIGTELGLRYSWARQCSSKHVNKVGGADPATTHYKVDAHPKEMSLKFYVEPSVRIGWLF